ncbi:hypothetical protein PG995_010043 [Apiospora arundinis]
MPPPPVVRTVRSLAQRFASHLPIESPDNDTPTRTINLASRITKLIPRLATGVSTVPEGYGHSPSGPEPGVVVGIVLGSIAGFLLLLWLIYTCVNLGNGRRTNIIVETEGSMVSDSVVTRKSRKHRRSHRTHSRSRSVGGRRETIEIREQRVNVPTERIVVEETTRSRGPPPPRMPVPGPPPPRQVPPPMSDSEDDEVVVIEEHTPPRRRESRRQRRRSSERRSSGYRDVDPYRYAGGDEPMRSVSRRRSESRRRYD